jgi:molecular chaperone GrpE
MSEPDTTTADAAPPTSPEARLAALQKERDDLFSRFVRQAADFDNFMKRSRAEVESTRQMAVADLLRGIIPVLDDLDRAITASAAGGEKAGQLAAGVRQVQDKFLSVLRKNGVEAVESVGKPFDASIHEIVATEPSSAVPDGTVLEEYSKGYRLNGRGLRPARVKTSRAPDEHHNT